MITPRQTIHLTEIARKYPQAWKQAESFRLEPPVRWPDWCFLPLAAAYAIVSGGGSHSVSLDRAGDIAIVGALSAWRVTQGIYRFDPDVFDAVWSTPMDRAVPVEILELLPEWCVYVETPGRWLHGFYAHLEYDPNNGRRELRLLLDQEQGLSPLPIHLNPGWTIEQGLQDAVHESYSQAAARGIVLPAGALEMDHGPAGPLVSLLLYLCSITADYRDARGTSRLPGRPEPTRTRKGVRIFPADHPTVWETGWRMGSALRAAREAAEREEESEAGPGGRTRPRPHVRRAHWHTFWTGPKQGTRKAVVKWLPPIPVNLEAGDIVPTIRPVR